MPYTWADVCTEARYMLRDENGTFNWNDTLAMFLANDAVELIYKIICRIAPNLYEKSQAINVLAGKAGPYNLPDDFHSVIHVLDSNGRTLDLTTRAAVASTVAYLSGEPTKYYLSGRAPTTLYYNKTPKRAYAHTLWYRPLFTRVVLTVSGAIPATAVPLDDETRSAVREWIVKFCGIIDEYLTMDEEKKLSIMLPLIQGSALSQANAMELTISGVGF